MPFGIPSEDFRGGFGLSYEENFKSTQRKEENTKKLTQTQIDEILSYIANNFISPLCFDKRPTKEIYLEYSGKKFNDLVAFCRDLLDEG